MAETRTYQGRTYKRENPGDPWVLVAQPQSMTVGTPSARSATDIANTQSTMADRAADNARADAAAAREAAAADRERLEWEASHFPDGTPKPKAAAAAHANPDRVPQIETMLSNIRRVREMADDNLAVGKWSGRVGDWPLIGPWLGQNRADIEGALQMIQGDLIQQQIAILSQMNAGKGVASIANSETEAARMAASVANLSPDQSLEEFLVGLDRAEQYYLRQLDRQQVNAAPIALNAAGQGAASQAVPIPPEMQAENEAWLASNLATATPQAYAQFRQALDRKYGFPQSASDIALTSWFEAAQRKAAQGGEVAGAIPPATEELSGFDKLRNDIVSHPLGSFVTSAANAGGFGLPTLLARDEMEAMRELNPVSSFLGEVGGGVTGTLTGGAALGALGTRVGNETVERLLSNPMLQDMAYGGVYGATQAEDPLYGAVLGAGAAAGGSWAGSQVGKRLGGRGAADTLSRGERAVFNAVGDTDPVIAALQQADELSVPATIADVSSGANTLTGAALRRSPAAAGDARIALGDRSRGQYDRFLGAVERDLGPIENIPQRSEDLITQARAQAGALYDKAYAAPPANLTDLIDLLERPSMNKALPNARRIAAEEGRSPDEIGIYLDGNDLHIIDQPSWQTLDYVKRGLDDVLEGYRDKTTGKLVLDTEGRAVNDTLRDYLARLDAMNPDYAAARAAYAGPASEREAMQRGAQALSMSPNQLEVNMARASPSQAEQMRLGFQSALGERAGNFRHSTNPFESTLGTPGMEQRLATLYPEGGDEIARLLAQRDLERELVSSTNRLIGNSMTAERQVADQAFGQDGMVRDMATGTIETLLTGAPVVTAARSGIGRTLGNSLRDARTLGIGSRATRLADEIVPIALNMDPSAAAASLEDLAARDAAYQALVEELMKRAALRGGHVGGGAASVLVN